MPRLAAEQLPPVLQAVLRERLAGAASARISDWTGSPRGFATETYLFDLQREHDTIPLVFRRPPQYALFPDYDLLRQVLVMRRLAGSGLPVPAVHFLDRDGGPLGSPYYVMQRLAGDAPGDFPSYHADGLYHTATPEQRSRMWWGCVDAIADIHHLDWHRLRLDFLAVPGGIVGYLGRALHWAAPQPHPALKRAVDWLDANGHRPDDPVLCWGDARMSNILYDTGMNVTGVLDWELAHLGDHEADLAWMLFLDWANSTYEGRAPLPGTPTRRQTIEYYQERSGRRVRNLRHHEVLAAVLLAIPLLRMAAHLDLPPEIDVTAFCVARIEELLS